MGQFLSQPITEKHIKTCEFDKVSHVVGEMQGYRLTMEDAYCDLIVEPDRDSGKAGYTVFGVFDGHGGADASKYIGARLPQIISERLEAAINGISPRQHPEQGAEVSTLTATIDTNTDTDTLISTSVALEKDATISSENSKKPALVDQLELITIFKSAFMVCDNELYNKGIRSGSTAVVAIMIDGYLVVANVGDSRCILSCDKGAPKMLSFDHKPKNFGELLRIRNDGGYVTDNRVNGVLALSRAFGDFSFKMHNANNHHRITNTARSGLLNRKAFDSLNTTNQPSQSQQQQPLRAASRQKLTSPEEYQVTVDPEIIYHKLNSSDEFIVLACDGIWDCYKTHKLVQLIRNQLALGKRLDEIIELILENCLNMANTITGIGFDNMTIIIVALHENIGTLEDWYLYMKNKVLDEKFGRQI
ncbi:unnamed protein product [Kuraishia capsulata CBS 1993]|uniref:protein-serine/threonine phosphatase n=1 Tax=Kuraishia capsulata CBS 1993 TaxID=1382522 RepID=W6MX73_9ASCO|nr:uncharacterized protein KUCA_T00004372001 [Kuraishia capsulata CBS 1993]CDK28390.1 unnamed protein product [Kuraishia capsulata CBS 1993]